MNKNFKAFLFYLLLTVIFTWPLLPNITTSYPSTLVWEGGDPNMYIWFMDLIAKKIADPKNFHPSQMIFYPFGMNLYAGYEGIIALPFSTPIILLTRNPILAYNIILLLAFALTCYTSYLLIHYLTKSYLIALATGFTFGLSPYMLVRGLQHLDLLFLFPIPLVVLSAFKFLENPGRRTSLFLTLAVFLTALSAWYYLVGVLLFLFIVFLFNFSKFLRAKTHYLITGFAIALVALLPALPMLINRNTTTSFKYVAGLIDTRGANPLNFFVPHPYASTWNLTQSIYQYFVSPYEATSYFGLVGLIALFTLLFLSKRVEIADKNLWIAVIVFFTLLAMGNFFEWRGYQIPLPFNFFSRFLPFNRLRAPNRFFIFAYLGTTVIFGYFLTYAKKYFTRRNLSISLGILLFIVLVSERLNFPYPIMSILVSDFYLKLGARQEQSAIADIPFINPGISLYNYYQIYHKKPIVDGEYFWTAYNTQTFNFIKTNPLLLNSVPCEFDHTQNLKSRTIDKQHALKHLAAVNIRYIVVHNLILHNFECDSLTRFIHNFFANRKPLFSDGEITVYSTNE